MKHLFIISILLFSWFATAQSTDENVAVNESLLAEKLAQLRAAKTDQNLKAYNDTFKQILIAELEKNHAKNHALESLNSIGKLTSDDKLVRVFSWNYQKESEENVYSAIVLRYDKRKKKNVITELKRNEFGVRVTEKAVLDKNNWYGCLYYDIIDIKKGSKTYYTLLGYDQKNGLTHTKLIDVLYFAGNNPKLGYNLFKIENGIQKRVFMEHAKKATMTLRYDETRDKIVFDHLSPESQGLAEFREYWVPDMSYDAMTFTNGKWILEEDIIAVNKETSNKLKIETYDEKNDTIKSIEIKNKWESPDGKHTAIVPDDIDKNKVKEQREKANKSKKEKNPKFNGVSYGSLGKKKKK